MLMMALIAAAIAGASETNTPDQGRIQYAEISAKEVQANAKTGPVIYDQVAVIGDLELNSTQYNLRITNSRITGNITCSGTTFGEKVDFSNTLFEGDAAFNGTKFLSEANFNCSHFEGDTSFNMSTFIKGGTFDFASFTALQILPMSGFDQFGTFYNASFLGDAQFYLSQFNGAYANFEETRYLGDAHFSGCQFNTYSSFAGAKFERTANFQGSKFVNGASFQYAKILGSANFARSHLTEDSLLSEMYFGDSADFTNTKFDGPLFFVNTRFCGDALFNNSQFLAPTDFSGAQFDKDLAMNNTKINTMMLEDSVFSVGSRLFLAKADLNRFMVSWSQIQNILSYDNSAYLSLVKNFRDIGQSSDANDCYYEYRYLNQNRKGIGVSKFLDMVAWITCGYGVRPHHALACGAVVILIIALIIWSGKGLEGFNDLSEQQKVTSSLYYSLIAFTANGKGLPFKGNYRYLGIAEGILGWLLMALFLVTLGRLMIG